MRYFSILLLIAGLSSLASCVSRARYDEVQATLQYYKTEALVADSINYANERMNDETSALETNMEELTLDVERLKATNISLNRSYQDVLGRYNKLLEQSNRVLTNYGDEKTDLQQDLAAREAEITRKEQALYQMSLNLQQKESELLRIRGGSPQGQGVASQQGQIQMLQARLADQERKLGQIQMSLRQALAGYNPNDLTIQSRNGRLIISLSQNLLFGNTNNQINSAGLQALRQVANVLRQYREFRIMVEGHTNPGDDANFNWDLSADRALRVVKLLTNSGVNPSRMTASGRSSYAPIVPNSSAANQIINRRTEIIIVPDYEELFSLLPTN